jgi:hypothetical protein
MLIQFESSITGLNFEYGPGDICEWDDGEAKRFIAAGIAIEVTEEQQAATNTSHPVRQQKLKNMLAQKAPEKMTSR